LRKDVSGESLVNQHIACVKIRQKNGPAHRPAGSSEFGNSFIDADGALTPPRQANSATGKTLDFNDLQKSRAAAASTFIIVPLAAEIGT
jgi:hypothetical protein